MAIYPFENENLPLRRCPHCSIANPLIRLEYSFASAAAGGNQFRWNVYVCTTCARPVIGGGDRFNSFQTELFPSSKVISEDLPTKAGAFLQQAMDSLHAPSGSIMLCASCVDAMLKEKGLKNGGLYKRIELAAESGLITSDMAAWAHEVRLDANDERHADDSAELPSEEDAKKCIDFVNALGDFMFVLPARIERGREKPPEVGHAGLKSLKS